MSVQVRMEFDAMYDCEVLEELPQPERVRHLYYPGATQSGGSDGVTIRVRTAGEEPWIGTFAYGVLTPHSVSGVFSTPSPDRLCVVSRGRGFFVSASHPARHEEIRFHPILDVRPIPSRGLIVFANFTELLAYGEAGVRWRTARLSWDSMKITEVTDDVIKGEFWDIQSEEAATFTVDLETGKHQGGVQFPG